MTSLVTRGLRLGYHGLRAGLFRYAGGDPERVHEDMIRALSHVPAGGRAPVVDPVTVAGVGSECGASLAAPTVRVALSLPAATVTGNSVAPAGSPEAVRLTAPLKPFLRVTLTSRLAL